MAVLLRVDLDVVVEDKVHDPIKCNECALEKYDIVKGDAHKVGRHVNRGGAKDGRRWRNGSMRRCAEGRREEHTGRGGRALCVGEGTGAHERKKRERCIDNETKDGVYTRGHKAARGWRGRGWLRWEARHQHKEKGSQSRDGEGPRRGDAGTDWSGEREDGQWRRQCEGKGRRVEGVDGGQWAM